MTIKPIKTERDRQKALKEIDKLLGCETGYGSGRPARRFGYIGGGSTSRGDTLSRPRIPVEAIKFRMDQLGLKSVRSRENPRRAETGPRKC